MPFLPILCDKRRFVELAGVLPLGLLGRLAVAAFCLSLTQTAAAGSPATAFGFSGADAAESSHAVRDVETTSSLFASLGIKDPELEKFVFSDVDAAVFAKPKSGQFVVARLLPDGRIESISMYGRDHEGSERRTTVSRANYGFSVTNDYYVWEKRLVMAAVKVDDLFKDRAAEAGIPDDVIRTASGVPLDSSTLVRKAVKGDTVSVIYEDRFIDGRRVASGRLLGIELAQSDETTPLFWFDDGSKGGGYYTENGEAPGSAFMRYPMYNYRITSRFSYGRRHPVNGRVKAHRGLDLAAPRGTPVYAASNGVVKAADRALRGYGKRIDIAHTDTITTRYAHLQGFAKGIRVGTKVKKGQLIGYCGSTGIATGSHLHYEFRVNGNPVNPETVKIPTGSKLSGKYMASNRDRVAELRDAFRRLKSLQVANNGDTVPPVSAAIGTAIAAVPSAEPSS